MSPDVALEKDVNLALALAAGASTAEAAAQCGVSQRTVQRQLLDPQFRKLVYDLRDQYLSRALGRMADSMAAAAEKLVALLQSDKPGVQLRTARAILSLGLRLHASVQTEQRLSELEAELARKQGLVPYEE